MRMQALCNERRMAGACGIGVLHTPWLANTWVQSGVAFCDGGKLRGQPQLAMQHLWRDLPHGISYLKRGLLKCG